MELFNEFCRLCWVPLLDWVVGEVLTGLGGGAPPPPLDLVVSRLVGDVDDDALAVLPPPPPVDDSEEEEGEALVDIRLLSAAAALENPLEIGRSEPC